MRRAAGRVLTGLAAGTAVAAPAAAPASVPVGPTARALAAVAEPASLVLLGAGLLGVALLGYLRRRRKPAALTPPRR